MAKTEKEHGNAVIGSIINIWIETKSFFSESLLYACMKAKAAITHIEIIAITARKTITNVNVTMSLKRFSAA